PHFAGLFAQLRWGALWREIAATRRLHGYSPAASMMHVANVLLPRPVRKVARRLGARTVQAPGWLDLRALDARPSDPFADRGAATPDVRALSIAQLTATNLQMLLHWEDRDSMAHSIESRVPFLDYRLVEFVLGLPVEYKLAGGMTKRVLREGMRGVLPERVRTRVDKLGFATPEEVWVREEAPERFRQAVRRAVEVSGGILTGEAVEKTERILAGTERFEPFPWRVISFASWLETFGIRG
ncbi:MAG TPA: asparagine synthase-related protein, partial [Longimicrobium sp.]|nr:asparagine synthase-related protein [Longimicrobium sp.]